MVADQWLAKALGRRHTARFKEDEVEAAEHNRLEQRKARREEAARAAEQLAAKMEQARKDKEMAEHAEAQRQRKCDRPGKS